jgi:DNA-binding MarR family transcriptional regulator
MHTLEAVGKNGSAKTIGDVAQILGVTMPSVTVAIRRLEKKGLVLKTRSDGDGRSVHVRLTPFGERVDRLHQAFHQKMIGGVIGCMNDAERLVLLEGAVKLNSFFKNKLSAMEG